MRRPAAIIDENVRVGTGGERRLTARLGRDVAGNRGHLGAGFLADLRCGLIQRFLRTRGDDEVDPGSPQRHRAGTPEPFARRANNRLPAGYAKIEHLFSLRFTPCWCAVSAVIAEIPGAGIVCGQPGRSFAAILHTPAAQIRVAAETCPRYLASDYQLQASGDALAYPCRPF